VTWLAIVLLALALPALLARVTGGYPPNPGPELAALAPLAVVPAIAAVIIAAYAAWWLAALLAIPAALLVIWQLPPLRRSRFRAAAGPSRGTGSAAATLRLRLFSLNAKGGRADPAVILRILREHSVDVLAVQELTPPMVSWLTAAGLTQMLPFSHLDPRPGSGGTGLWARWPLTPLPPVPGMRSGAPRARIDPPGGFPVTLTAVHPAAPIHGRAGLWRRELAIIQTLAGVDEPQVVAGDFNASRDHRPFRELLAAGFADCADSGQNQSWPGFTWPAHGRRLPVMRLDHVLVSRTATVRMTRAIRVPRTDHHGVLAVIEFSQVLRVRGPFHVREEPRRIISFTVVRMALVALGIPRTRIRLFQQPVPARSSSSQPIGGATLGDRSPDPEAEGPPSEGASEASRT
jgi:endonuclease/exonuclease/phosphatase (EEP) superfamily protein YafD